MIRHAVSQDPLFVDITLYSLNSAGTKVPILSLTFCLSNFNYLRLFNTVFALRTQTFMSCCMPQCSSMPWKVTPYNVTISPRIT